MRTLIILLITLITINCYRVTSTTYDGDNEVEQNSNVTAYTLKDFQWTQCGSTDIIKLSRLQVDPDPMAIPGQLSIGFDVLLNANLSSPLPLTLKAKKKVFGVWIDLPCEKGCGSCKYPDLCSLWPYPKPCPEVYSQYNIPCSCPFIASRYNLPESIVGNATLPTEDIPKWLENGHYSIEARLSDQAGAEKFCIQILMQVKVSS